MLAHAALAVAAALTVASEESPLYRAACRGDVEAVRALAAGAPRRIVNQLIDTAGPTMTPLLCALEGRHVDVVRVLLEARADPNFADGTPPPLELALGPSYSDEASDVTVRLLLAAGARDDRGKALELAARRGGLAAIRLLVGKGAKPTGIEGRCDPLDAALMGRQLEAAKLLLEQGGAACPGASMGTWLVRACSLRFEEAIRLFLERGGDPNARAEQGPALLAYLGGGGGRAALATLELLAGRGAKLDAVGPRGGAYALAASLGDVEAFQWLLGKGVPVAPQCRAVLSIASSPDVAELARSSGCAVDPDGPALLDQAERGSAPMVRWLLAQGVKAEPRAPGAPAPLLRAVERGHLEVVRALLDAGADPARRNAAGESAMSVAARRREAMGYADELDGLLRARAETKRLQTEPLEVLIMGGGAQPADAEAALARARAEAEVLEAIAPLASGFPVVRRSDELEGLRPGFHVVLLGFCPKQDVAARLDLLRPLFPGTYSRPVKVALDGPACPQALGAVLDRTEVGLPGGGRLRAVLLAAGARTFARLEQTAKGGALVAARTVDVTATEAVPPSQATCTYRLAPGKGEIAFGWSCTGRFASMCRFADAETRWRFGVGAPGTFEVDVRHAGGDVVECAE